MSQGATPITNASASGREALASLVCDTLLRSSVIARCRYRHLDMLKQKRLNKGLFGILVVRSLLKATDTIGNIVKDC
jgi:hypothetical protein